MSTAPFPIDENRWLKIKPKVLLSFIGLVALAVASWGAIKKDLGDVRRDVTEQGKAIEVISTQLSTIERDAKTAREGAIRSEYQQEVINLKLDYLTGDKRGPRPATTASP